MNSLNLDIARRYLFGKKSTNSINIITGISVFGISIGTAALILILSVFNGFESLLSGLFNSFNPDLKVLPYQGKFFEPDSDKIKQIRDLPEVMELAATIEEVSLFEYKASKELGIIKGVDPSYVKVTRLDSLVIRGEYLLQNDKINYALVGAGMRNKLSLSLRDLLTPVTVYMPQKKQKIIGAKEFIARDLYPSGIFSVRSETDYQYIITNLDFVQKILDQEGKVSALEIKLSEKADAKQTNKRIQEILGSEFIIKNRYQQDEAYLKVMEIEKWFSFMIAGLTMLLIAFNLIGALWMIVLDKTKDIAVLKALGYDNEKLRRVFLYLGLLITFLGIVLGYVLALVFYCLQRNYGIIGIPEGFLIDAYPIKLKPLDFIIVSVTVAIIGLVASYLPAFKASKAPVLLKSQV